VVTTVVTYGAPHHLVADGPPLAHRRTAAGDAAAAGRPPATPGVLLGMPTVRAR
jgi:tRNA-2-methylthio-N6-dimethylallyladenosine synthase